MPMCIIFALRLCLKWNAKLTWLAHGLYNMMCLTSLSHFRHRLHENRQYQQGVVNIVHILSAACNVMANLERSLLAL